MKGFQLFITGLASIAIFAVPAVAQKEKLTTAVSNIKIAAVDTKAFEDKESGIKELIAAYNQLQVELNSQFTELYLASEKIQNLQKEIFGEIKENNLTNELLAAKIKERHSAINNFNAKESEFKSLYDRRKSEIFAPANNKIGDALK